MRARMLTRALFEKDMNLGQTLKKWLQCDGPLLSDSPRLIISKI